MRNLRSPFGLKSPFGSRKGVDYGDWVVSGTNILEAPTSRNPSDLSIINGAVYGPAGFYTVTNVTNSVTVEEYRSPPFALVDYGQAGDEFQIRHLTYSSNSPLIAVPAAGTLLTETWGGYSIGNTFTQLDTLYGRQDTLMDTDVVADADSASGQRVTVTLNTTNSRWWRRDDTVVADGTWTCFQARGRMKVPTGTNAVVAFGFGGNTAFTGVLISRAGTSNSGRIAWVNATDVSGSLMTTSLGTQIASGLGDASPREVLIDVASNKRDVRIRSWAVGSSEPTDWQAEFTLSSDASLATSGLRLMGRVATSGNTNRHLGWKLGLDTDATAF